MVRVLEYLDGQGRSVYARWFDSLNPAAAAKVAAAVYQLAGGNFSNVKSVGSGVFERKIAFGPGYRVYFARTVRRSSFCWAAARSNDREKR